jgi:hypothetical protein
VRRVRSTRRVAAKSKCARPPVTRKASFPRLRGVGDRAVDRARGPPPSARRGSAPGLRAPSRGGTSRTRAPGFRSIARPRPRSSRRGRARKARACAVRDARALRDAASRRAPKRDQPGSSPGWLLRASRV